MKRGKYKFSYGYWAGATVTVDATSEDEARIKARAEMDRRYEKLGKEPPVAWRLVLVCPIETQPGSPDFDGAAAFEAFQSTGDD